MEARPLRQRLQLAFLARQQVSQHQPPAFLDRPSRPRHKVLLLEVRKDLFSANRRLLAQQVALRYSHNLRFLRPLQLRMYSGHRQRQHPQEDLSLEARAHSVLNRARDPSSVEAQRHRLLEHPVSLVEERLSPALLVAPPSAQLHQLPALSLASKLLLSAVKPPSEAPNPTSSVRLQQVHPPTTSSSSSAPSSRVEISSEVFQHRSRHLKLDSRGVLSRAGVKYFFVQFFF